MSDWPRQLKHVDVTITGGDPEDRAYWANHINGYLQNQPCATWRRTYDKEEIVHISPDANND